MSWPEDQTFAPGSAWMMATRTDWVWKSPSAAEIASIMAWLSALRRAVLVSVMVPMPSATLLAMNCWLSAPMATPLTRSCLVRQRAAICPAMWSASCQTPQMKGEARRDSQARPRK